MTAAIKGGVLYFAIVFAAGFLLGALRVLALAPFVGELAATIFELPIILAISWWACGYTIDRAAVPAHAAGRIVMGFLAFALLMAAEVSLVLVVDGRLPRPESWLATAKLIGLAGQFLYATFPSLMLARGR